MRCVSRFVALSVGLCLLAAAVAFGIAGGVPAAAIGDQPVHAGTDYPAERTAQIQAAEQASQTEIVVALQPDQSAEWTVTTSYEFADATQREAFETTAEQYEAGDGEAGPRVDPFENIAAQASETTGRDMEITAVSREATVNQTAGELRVSFTWSQFLSRERGRLSLGDVFVVGEDERWLRSLSEDQVLRIRAPAGYSIESSTVSFEQNTVVQRGPHQFDTEEHISMTFEESGPSNPNSEEFPPFITVAAAGAVLLGGLAIGVLLWRRRTDATDAPAGADTVADTHENGSQRVPPSESGSGSETASAASAAEDLSLLSDEERVERLLERNGGRMKQAAIVTETEWSDAKVSQLLSAMAANDRVEKLRLGRENLISLPGTSPVDSGDEAAESDPTNGTKGSDTDPDSRSR